MRSRRSLTRDVPGTPWFARDATILLLPARSTSSPQHGISSITVTARIIAVHQLLYAVRLTSSSTVASPGGIAA